eukprot:6221851-Pyramimonas_sp.AAC.2
MWKCGGPSCSVPFSLLRSAYVTPASAAAPTAVFPPGARKKPHRLPDNWRIICALLRLSF